MMPDDDIDFIEVQKLITFYFLMDMWGMMFGPKPVRFSDEARLYPEGGKDDLRPIDRVFIARQIRYRFGKHAARAAMDFFPVFTLQ